MEGARRFAASLLLTSLACSYLCAPRGAAALGSAGVSNELVSKYRLPRGSPCNDSSGNVVANGASWSTGGACDLNTCYRSVYDGLSYYYVIRRTCRQILANENPEYGGQSSNCVVTSQPAQPYPYCCSYLSCASRPAAAPTTPAPACADVSSNRSCYTWGSVYGGCAGSSALFNLTSKYCRRYCSFC